MRSFMSKLLPIILPLLILFGESGCTDDNGTHSMSERPQLALYDGRAPIPVPDTMMLDLGDTRLFVSSLGQGPAIIVVHGGPGMSHHYLRPSLDYLARGYRLVYYDQRISGQSDATCDSTKITLAQWVEDLEEIRKALGEERVTVLSHSWGARVALRYAAMYPEHVDGLVFMNPVSLTSEHVQKAVATLQSRMTTRDQLAMEKVTNSEAFRAGEKPAIMKAYKLSFAQNIFRRAILDSLNLYIPERATVRQQGLGRLYQDPALSVFNDYSFLDQIQSPALIIHGSYDASPSEAMEEMKGHLAKGELIEIQDCGHFAMQETPVEVAEALESFLESSTAVRN